jgi:hypothetical protein
MSNLTRCGSPMNSYEASNGPMLERPACARPPGHRGRHRSAIALARKYRADNTRLAEARRTLGRQYGRPRLASAA